MKIKKSQLKNIVKEVLNEDLNNNKRIKVWELYHGSWNVWKCVTEQDAQKLKLFLEKLPHIYSANSKVDIREDHSYMDDEQIKKFQNQSKRKLTIEK